MARISDLLLHPGETIDYNGQRITFPEIKLIYWCGGNPFHHHQDINRLVQAWQRPETVIVHEIFWTPTARYADIVLPATTTLERNDIASSPDRYMFAMHQAIEPVGEARNDFDIFADLGERLGFREDFTEGRSEMEWLRHLYEIVRQQAARHGIERPDFETFWEQGYVADPVAKHYDYLSGYPRRSRRQEAQDAVRQDRDLLREGRVVRLRRLPRPSGLDRARRMARIAAGRAQAASDLQPADHAAACASSTTAR